MWWHLTPRLGWGCGMVSQGVTHLALDGPDATSPAIHPALNSQGPACLSPDRAPNQSSHCCSTFAQSWPAPSSLLLQLRCCSNTVGRILQRSGIETGRQELRRSYGDGSKQPSRGGSGGCGSGGYQAKQSQSPPTHLLALPVARRNSHQDRHCARAFQLPRSGHVVPPARHVARCVTGLMGLGRLIVSALPSWGLGRGFLVFFVHSFALGWTHRRVVASFSRFLVAVRVVSSVLFALDQ